MSYNNDSTSHPEKQVNLVQIAQEVVHNILQSYNPEPLEPDVDGLYHYIYITWNKDTYKFYVGKHSSKNPATDSYIGSGKHMLNAIDKYGVSSFEHRILQYTHTAQEAYELEAAIVTAGYIKLYRDELRITYNLVGGGEGVTVHSKETRQKMSEAIKKHYAENPETSEKHSEYMKKYFEDNPEVKQKHSEYMKQYYKDNPEVRQKNSERMQQFWDENPEAKKERGEERKKYFANPEVRQKNSERKKKYYEENPEAGKKCTAHFQQYWATSGTREKMREINLKKHAVKELTDLSGNTKIEVHRDEVLQYLKQGWYFNTRVFLHNPTTLQQVYIHVYHHNKCYKVANTPKIIKLLEEGWVLGKAPKN